MEWMIMAVLGPLLLGLGLLWAITHNRRSRAEKQLTEDATRQRRAEEHAAAKAREAGAE